MSRSAGSGRLRRCLNSSTRRQVGIWALICLTWVAGGSGCGAWRSRPNVVILLMDTLRPDRLGCYGYGRDTSPALDSLAARGALFTRGYATADYTPASTASLFTGCYPLAHGYVNADYVLEDANLTLAEILRDQGYRTAGFTANGLVGEKYRMDQGFDEFFEKNRASADEMVAQIAAFVRRTGDAPFFAYAHFMDVHDPQRIPESRRGRFADPGAFAHDMQDSLLHDEFVMRAWWATAQEWRDPDAAPDEVGGYFADYGQLYDAAIVYWDASLAGLFEALAEVGVERRTILIVTADHGEQLLEHGFFGHGNSGYDVGLRVPFILYDPTLEEAPGRIDRPVSLVDMLPTLLARLGVDVPDGVQGRELWSLVRGAEEEAAVGEQAIYTEGTFFANRPFSTLIQTYREGRWKLILDRFRDTKELYDLEDDPGEQRNRFADEPETIARLSVGLRACYHENLERFARLRRSEMRQQEEKLRELRALGYVAGKRGARPRTEFFPMKLVELTPFGPFGDEEDLAFFGEALDFTGGRVVWGQVIRGYSDVANRADPTGSWFDRRSTFLMRNGGGRSRAVFEINAVADGAGEYPTRIELEFDDRAVQEFAIDSPGEHRLEGAIPEPLRGEGYFYCGLRANHRFALQEGDLPRSRIHGSLKIRSVRLE